MTKKTCLSDLPNVLIIHLQRIIYNFDTYANEKINSRLEFPHVLNLEPYTRDSVLKQQAGESAVPQASPEFEYELVGVVMHRGVAEGGHYTSLIRHRNPEGVADPKRWYEFNDSLVRFYE
jgi:ubiquitin C-terminal hydrolase